MSSARKPSHPTHAHGLIDILEELPATVPAGSQFGYYACNAAIAVGGVSGSRPRDIVVEVTANTSQAHALAPNCLYTASLRLVKPEGADVFTAYYAPKQPYPVGPSTEAGDTTNQVSMSGFGIIVSKEETTSPDTGESILVAEVRHTDWEGEARKAVSFGVIYHTVKKGNLANLFGLFQLGLELFLTGVIVDWDDLKSTWIVQTGTIVISSGHQSMKAIPESPERRILGNIGGRPRVLVQGRMTPSMSQGGVSRSSTASFQGVGGTPTASPNHEDKSQDSELSYGNLSSSAGASNDITLPSDVTYGATTQHTMEHQPEEGEEVEARENLPFRNTFGKKRSHQDILKDARKTLRS